MSSKTLLLSIRPKYAELIFSGRKTAELRRVRPQLQEGDLVLIYVSAPVKALMGSFKVQRVIHGSPRDLWSEVGKHSGLTKKEFEIYYSGLSLGFAIFASKVWRLEHPIKLSRLKQRWNGFSPPQGFRYVTLRNKSLFTGENTPALNLSI